MKYHTNEINDLHLQWIEDLVGTFTDKMVQTLIRNIEYYVMPDFGLFIPVAGYCDYAIMPNHSHPSYSFIYHSGSGPEILYEKKVIQANPPKNFCAISPGVAHQEIQNEGFNSYCAIVVSPVLLERVLAEYTAGEVPEFKVSFYVADSSLMHLLKMFMTEFSANLSGRNSVLESYKTAIVHACIRTCLDFSPAGSRSDVTMEFNNLISYLIENLEKKITLKDMAEYVSMSPSHFTRKFRQFISMPPMEYLNDLRIEKAKRLIKASSLNLTEIAMECGFSNSSYFSTRFTEKVNVSPIQYRKKFSL